MIENTDHLALLIKRVARGRHGSDHLNRIEAALVFFELLKPDADMLQLGAFLIAERMKGETSDELAGFVDAARQHCQSFGQYSPPKHSVDLPCYAGKRRGPHAHLAAALKARDAGIPIFVHGIEHIEDRITAWQILEKEGVHRAQTLSQAHQIMLSDGLVYMDLAQISPNLHRIYQLRPRLGVRSFANTVARLLNPMQCTGQLNGFFHTPYADYMAQANVLLGQPRSLIFMGAEGEPELYADRQKIVKSQISNIISDISFNDSGFTPYPKTAVEHLDSLFEAFKQLPSQAVASREHATIERMNDAFSWASERITHLNHEHKSQTP